MLGADVVRDYPVVNHSAVDKDALKEVGVTPEGIPIWLNRRWVESDVRITTGFVEPHLFAGFSGGPKMVAPWSGRTRHHNEAPQRVPHRASQVYVGGSSKATPIHDAIRSIAAQTGVDFSVDVTINRDHKITSVYAGELFAVHRAACQGGKGRGDAPGQQTLRRGRYH